MPAKAGLVLWKESDQEWSMQALIIHERLQKSWDATRQESEKWQDTPVEATALQYISAAC